MKILKHLSLISIVITTYVLAQKIKLDFDFYNFLNTEINHNNMQPTLVASRMKSAMIFVLPVAVALLLSIIGLKLKNKFKRIAFTLNVISLIYIFISGAVLMSNLI